MGCTQLFLAWQSPTNQSYHYFSVLSGFCTANLVLSSALEPGFLIWHCHRWQFRGCCHWRLPVLTVTPPSSLSINHISMSQPPPPWLLCTSRSTTTSNWWSTFSKQYLPTLQNIQWDHLYLFYFNFMQNILKYFTPSQFSKKDLFFLYQRLSFIIISASSSGLFIYLIARWADEAAALNIIKRSYLEPVEPLDYEQGAPIGFFAWKVGSSIIWR